MEDLVTTKFFGFYPEELYTAIYAIGHNEYLKAVRTLKETLLHEFPEKEEEIELKCGQMLEAYSQEFDQKWFSKFMGYCSNNIFTVKPNIPVYKTEMEDIESNQQADAKSLNLRHCIMATEYLNVQLLGKLRDVDAELERRKELLAKTVRTEQKLESVKRGKELEQRLNSVELPEEM